MVGTGPRPQKHHLKSVSLFLSHSREYYFETSPPLVGSPKVKGEILDLGLLFFMLFVSF
jgi:hypothetical protein